MNKRTAMVAFRSYNTATWLPELPAIIGWQDMIDEIAHIIRTVKPTAIVCPHPIIDRHPDHRYATHMVVAALQQNTTNRYDALLLSSSFSYFTYCSFWSCTTVQYHCHQFLNYYQIMAKSMHNHYL